MTENSESYKNESDSEIKITENLNADDLYSEDEVIEYYFAAVFLFWGFFFLFFCIYFSFNKSFKLFCKLPYPLLFLNFAIIIHSSLGIIFVFIYYFAGINENRDSLGYISFLIHLISIFIIIMKIQVIFDKDPQIIIIISFTILFIYFYFALICIMSSKPFFLFAIIESIFLMIIICFGVVINSLFLILFLFIIFFQIFVFLFVREYKEKFKCNFSEINQNIFINALFIYYIPWIVIFPMIYKRIIKICY